MTSQNTKLTDEQKIEESKNIQGTEYKDYVECKICGLRTRTTLVKHFKTKHNISNDEYRKLYNVRVLTVDGINHSTPEKLYERSLTKEYQDKMKSLIEESKSIDGIEYKDYVECKICGFRSKKTLAGHIKTYHQMTTDDYRKQHNVRIISVEGLGWGLGEKNNAYQHGGRLSPWSDKFVNPNNINIEECRKQAHQTMLDNGNSNTTLTYWTNKGYSEQEAKELLSERQATFTLEKCIKKYGEDEGTRKWKERQEKWQKTLASKPPEEIEEINRSKSTKINYRTLWTKELDSPGIFYIIKLNDDFVKIGISSKEISKRYHRDTLNKYNYEVFNDMTINQCFMLEQIVKHVFKKFKIKKLDQIGDFGWTETFNVKYDEMIDYCKSKTTTQISEEFNSIFKR